VSSPAISQCPVVVSFPSEAMAARPKLPLGSGGRRERHRADVAEAERLQMGDSHFTRREDVTERVRSPRRRKRAASGISPMPTLSSTTSAAR
jgi:hypothetical protein